MADWPRRRSSVRTNDGTVTGHARADVVLGQVAAGRDFRIHGKRMRDLKHNGRRGRLRDDY